ncbi:MAG: PorT family protein [Haliscomenobacter sp.]|nr:PorT family protein [Haliscomenobacter sp.]
MKEDADLFGNHFSSGILPKLKSKILKVIKDMKKIILLITAIVFMASSVIGQSGDSRSQFHFGLKAGVNFANVYDAQGEEFTADGKIGFAGGAFVSIPIGSVFGFQPEILFSQKGFKAEGKLLGANYGLTRTTSFIDVPLFLAVKPVSALTLLAGPQFSYLMKRKDEFNSAAGTIEQIEEFENDNIRKNILGAVLGVDINVSQMVVGARAAWDLSTNNGDGSSDTPRYKNAWVQATLGFRF